MRNKDVVFLSLTWCLVSGCTIFVLSSESGQGLAQRLGSKSNRKIGLIISYRTINQPLLSISTNTGNNNFVFDPIQTMKYSFGRCMVDHSARLVISFPC